MLAFQRGDLAERAQDLGRGAGYRRAHRRAAAAGAAAVAPRRGRAPQWTAGEARTRFDAALALARDLDDKRLLSETERHLGLLLLKSGDPQRALEHCERALEIAEAAGIRVDVGRALLALGEVHAATLFDDTGDGERLAEDYFTRGVELFREIGNEAELASGSSASASIASSAATSTTASCC